MKLKMLENFQGCNVPTLHEGQEVEVGQELAAWLLEHRKAVEVKPDPKPEPVLEPAVEVDATKAALELAAEYDVDLGEVEGTGSGGRVILSDVEAYLEGGE